MKAERPKPLPPRSTVGILGGGQLGRMLASAAARLGLKTCIFTDKSDSPAFDVSSDHIEAPFNDMTAIRDFADRIDVATYEFENIPPDTLTRIGETKPVFPDTKVLAITNDRLTEKQFVQDLGLHTTNFWQVDNLENLAQAFGECGGPAILKTRRFGYDGKGQVKITRSDQLEAAWRAIGGNLSILEAFVPFEREISIILARGQDGGIEIYDPGDNHHENHILATTTLPSSLDPATQDRARSIGEKIANAFEFVGVIAVELFVENSNGEDLLRINEIAPRVHNSGHWTLDGAVTSQFEQHIRAVCGWPLGSPARKCDLVMVNLIGDDIKSWQRLATDPAVKLHVYGKRDIAEGRKMGHYNRLGPPRR